MKKEGDNAFGLSVEELETYLGGGLIEGSLPMRVRLRVMHDEVLLLYKKVLCKSVYKYVCMWLFISSFMLSLLFVFLFSKHHQCFICTYTYLLHIYITFHI